ncbi:MAG: SurA N-terminal domain-containing protein, partial [Myxococcota bacterium]|nr:SurA N-terminal domain-containing protein [Myxococcota bacterium]
MPRLIALLACIALLIPGAALAAELVDQIVVVVNDDLILESEVDEEINMYLEMDPDALPVGPDRLAALAELREIVVDGLIGRQLMDQAVVRLGITVEEMEVQAQLGETARMNNMSVDQLKAQLARQ